MTGGAAADMLTTKQQACSDAIADKGVLAIADKDLENGLHDAVDAATSLASFLQPKSKAKANAKPKVNPDFIPDADAKKALKKKGISFTKTDMSLTASFGDCALQHKFCIPDCGSIAAAQEAALSWIEACEHLKADYEKMSQKELQEIAKVSHIKVKAKRRIIPELLALFPPEAVKGICVAPLAAAAGTAASSAFEPLIGSPGAADEALGGGSPALASDSAALGEGAALGQDAGDCEGSDATYMFVCKPEAEPIQLGVTADASDLWIGTFAMHALIGYWQRSETRRSKFAVAFIVGGQKQINKKRLAKVAKSK